MRERCGRCVVVAVTKEERRALCVVVHGRADEGACRSGQLLVRGRVDHFSGVLV